MSLSDQPVFTDQDDDCDEFVHRIRKLCRRDARDEEFVELISQALRGEFYAGAIRRLIYECADIDLQGALERHEQQIRADIEAEIEAQYNEEFHRIKQEYEDKATYQLIEKRFLSDAKFRERVLRRIRDDLDESKSKGEISKLFELTLEYCDQESIVDLLIKDFADDLMYRFQSEIIAGLTAKFEPDIRKEIKHQLSSDKAYMQGLKEELLSDVARRLFD